MGKTATSELAYLGPPATTNPHDKTRTPGGSSSGSAASVASYMAPASIGSQTGGSIIRPASYCGVVGYKPSYGLISRNGVLRTSYSLDHIGIFGRKVDTTTAKIATYQKTIAGLTTEYQGATKIVTALEPVVPLLKESLTKAQEAAAKASGDKEVAELVAKLLATSKARTTTLEENRKLAATKNAALTKEKATLAAAEKELATAQANLKQAQETITKATAALKPARVKAAYDKTRADKAAEAVANSEQQVKHWQDEIAFVKLLTELFAKRTAAEEKLLAQQEQFVQV